MSSDDALRYALIESSRGRALRSRNRFRTTAASLPGAALGAAAVMLASGVLGRRHKLAAAALFLAGGAWLARYVSNGSASLFGTSGEFGHNPLPELVGSVVDISSSHSFPASDPPTARR